MSGKTEKQEKKNAKQAAETAVVDDTDVVATENETPVEESPVETEAGAVDEEDETVENDDLRERRKLAGIGNIQRYKGLGEMNADELWETTMDPANRVLLKVTIGDAEKADAIFNKLMGEEVLLRKNFISSRATTLSDDDLDV